MQKEFDEKIEKMQKESQNLISEQQKEKKKVTQNLSQQLNEEK